MKPSALKSRPRKRLSSHLRRDRLGIERLEARELLAFSVANADPTSIGGLKLVVDFNQAVDAATVQAADLVVDTSLAALGFTVVDADTVEFQLPALAAGPHTVSLAQGSIADTLATSLDAFNKSFNVAASAQYIIQQTPRLQLGNAPLTGYAGSALDQVDLLWQTEPAAGAGVNDTFTVQFRPAGSNAAWQSVNLNAQLVTGVQNRVMHGATVTGLNWNSDYEYRVRQLQADVITNVFQSTFHTRLQAGDQANFSFAAYGDSASGNPPTGFKNVQSRINQSNAAFSVLLGDNVYQNGTHDDYDLRFNATINPPAATWTASHIDYLGVGNHDIQGDTLGVPMEQVYSNPIPVAGVNAPASVPATERPEHNYSFDYGDVHFVTFDSNGMQNPDAANMTRINAQLAWVEADLAASTARWKVVFVHHLLGGMSDQGSFTPDDAFFNPIITRLKAAGADLYMSGHAHSYGWSYPLTGSTGSTANFVNRNADDYFFSSDGLVELVSGAGGVGMNAATGSNYMAAAYGSATGGRDGYSLIDVTHNTLTVKYVAANDGATIDSFVISKDAPHLIAKDDSATTNKNNPKTISVLANDVTNVGTPFVQSTSTPAHGTVTINANNTLTYTPTNGYVGSDSFTYTSADTSGTSTATVNIVVTPTIVTTSFQQGTNSYTGAVDTYTASDNATGSNAAAQTIIVDVSPIKHTLMRFDNIFGDGPGQVPLDATNVTATLTIFVTDGGAGLNFHRMLIPWSDTATYTTTGAGTGGFNSTSGIQADGVEARTTADTVAGPTGAVTAPGQTFTYDVSASVQAWLAAPASNLGWGILPPTTDDSVQFASAEGVTVAQRPKLSISFSIDRNFAPVANADAVSVTKGVPVNFGVLDNDTDINGDPLSIQSVGAAAHGTVLLNSDKTITYRPAAGYLGADSFAYTISDGTLTSQATVSLTVTGPTTLPAAYFNVVQNDINNTNTSITITPVTPTQATPEMTVIAANNSRGDYAVQIGTSVADDAANGTLITSVSENGKVYPISDTACGTGTPCTVATTKFAISSIYTANGGYMISTSIAAGPGVAHIEANQSVSAGYFPASQFKTGTVTTTAAPFALAAATVAGGGPAINPLTDGVLLVNSVLNGNTYAAATPTASGWNITNHAVNADSTTYIAGTVAWVWVPYSTSTSLAIAGRISSNATTATGAPSIVSSPGVNATISAPSPANGQYTLSIPGHSPSTGVLLIVPENNNNASDNILSFQASGSSWAIEQRDLPGTTTVNPALQAADQPSMGLFTFVFIPTVPPADPVVQVDNILDLNGGVLKYTGGAALPNLMNVSDSGGILTITDDQPITLSAAVLALGTFTGNGTNTVTGPISAFTSLSIDTADANDTVTVGALSKPISVAGGGQANDKLIQTEDLNLATVSFTGFNGGVTQASGKYLTATTATLGGSVGTALTPFRTIAGSINLTGSGNGIFVTETDGADLTFSVGGANSVNVNNLTGSLNLAGASSTVTGNVTLISSDAININANLNAGSGTITIAANNDGEDNQGFTQSNAATITTTNATANAFNLTVNTSIEGDGNAVVSNAVVDSGTYTVNANGGSITLASTGAFTIDTSGTIGAKYTGTQAIRANSVVITTKGTGAIGTPTLPLEINSNGVANRTASLTAGTGGIYLGAVNGTVPLSVTRAVAEGGDILIASISAGPGDLTINGPVRTTTGSIRILGDDQLLLDTNAVIGGAGFSGTVLLQGNFDGTNQQGINMNGNASVSTTNTTANAVKLEVTGTTIAGGIPTLIAQNITTGDGGTITLNAAARAATQGMIQMGAGKILNAGPSGHIVLNAVDNPIGTAAAPVVAAGGTIQATTNSTTSTTNTGQLASSIFITSNAAASMQAVTTTAGTRIGTIALTTTAGALTINGPTNADSGTVTMTGAAGVNVSGVLGDANSTGDITVAATTGNVVFNTNPFAATYNLKVTGGALTEGIVGPLAAPNLTVTAPASLAIKIDGKAADQFTQIVVPASGFVTLSGDPVLSASFGVGYVPQVGDSIRIIDNQTAADVTGTFKDLVAPVAQFAIGSTIWEINYKGGDGNDVVLTALVVNAAPTDIQLSASAVAENSLGATIGNVTVVDPDVGDTHALVVNDARFEIVAGVLKLKDLASLDHEAAGTVTINITATDAGNLSFNKDFVITVTNVNEAPTNIALSASTVAENNAGAIIGDVTVTDPDGDASFTYIVSDNRFEVVNGQLKLVDLESLNYEAENQVTLTIEATDAGTLKFSKQFTIDVTDVNEAPTAISLSNSAVAENAAGAIVGDVLVADPDGDTVFTYETPDARFEIVNGQLKLVATESFDFETDTGTYLILVRAIDAGLLSYTQVLSITVSDVNEAPTNIALSANVVAENAANATIGIVTVSDPDAGDSGAVTVNDARFVVTGGVLKTAAALNFEAGSAINIILTATDAGGLSKQQPFTINITNVNEAPTNLALSANTVAENAVAAEIGTLTPTDPDAGDTFSYVVSDARFTVTGGKLFLASGQSLNFEAEPAVSLDVTVKDAGLLSFTKTFTINVTDVNEAPTNISLSTNVVAENAAGAEIGTLTTTDPDSGNIFSYVVSDARFTVTGGKLMLIAGQSLNYEAESQVSLDITSKDGGNLSFTKNFTIFVGDVNEAPTDVSLSANVVAENAAGAQIGTLATTDPDSADTFSYTVSDSRFEVVGDKLKLKPATALDFEAGNQITVSVTSTDAGGLSKTKDFTIDITNVNEAPTSIALVGQTVNEATDGAIVGDVNVTDPDVGDSFSYTISDNRFEVAAGKLKLKAGQTLDFETATSVNLNITAKDAGNLPVSQAFTITVQNVNEAPTLISLTGNPVQENSPGLIVIGTLTATDPDAGQTHAFVSNDTRFDVVGNQLRLKAGQSLDFEQGATVQVSITATDNGAPVQSRTQNVPVTVTNVNEAPLNIALSRNKIFTNLAGAWVATVTITEPDAGDTHIYTFNDNRFEVRGGELYLKAGMTVAPAETTINLSVTARDAAGLSVQKSFVLTSEAAPANWTRAHQWKQNPYDVNADGQVTPIDALYIINELNAVGPYVLPAAAPGTAAPLFFDVSGDGVLGPDDAVMVINQLNAGGGGEGEAADVAVAAEAVSVATTSASSSTGVQVPYLTNAAAAEEADDADSAATGGLSVWNSVASDGRLSDPHAVIADEFCEIYSRAATKRVRELDSIWESEDADWWR